MLGKLLAAIALMLMGYGSTSDVGPAALPAPKPHLTATVIKDFGASPLYPGGPASTATVRLRYQGGQAAIVSLVARQRDFAARIPSHLCSASDPEQKFLVALATDGGFSYVTQLSDFESDGVVVLGQAKAGAWSPGESHLVRLAISLDRSADNSYMGCTADVAFAWSAA